MLPTVNAHLTLTERAFQTMQIKSAARFLEIM